MDDVLYISASEFRSHSNRPGRREAAWGGHEFRIVYPNILPVLTPLVAENNFPGSRSRLLLTLPFLNFAISEVQEMSHRPPYHWNVLSEQRKSKWQHPNTEHREETQYSATDECDTSGHPYPDRMLSTKALDITPNPDGHVILKAIHFLVEIGGPGHAHSKGMHSICSDGERSKKSAHPQFRWPA